MDEYARYERSVTNLMQQIKELQEENKWLKIWNERLQQDCTRLAEEVAMYKPEEEAEA